MSGSGLVDLHFPREHSLATRAWPASRSNDATFGQDMSVNGEVNSATRVYLWLGPLLN